MQGESRVPQDMAARGAQGKCFKSVVWRARERRR